MCFIDWQEGGLKALTLIRWAESTWQTFRAVLQRPAGDIRDDLCMSVVMKMKPKTFLKANVCDFSVDKLSFSLLSCNVFQAKWNRCALTWRERSNVGYTTHKYVRRWISSSCCVRRMHQCSPAKLSCKVGVKIPLTSPQLSNKRCSSERCLCRHFPAAPGEATLWKQEASELLKVSACQLMDWETRLEMQHFSDFASKSPSWQQSDVCSGLWNLPRVYYSSH